MSTGDTPIYLTAIIFSILAWFSWLLCIAPLVWHFSQRNVAAGSLVLWIILTNFSLGINPIIWPRDNVEEWWNGNVWCDINVRIQVGGQVGLAASMVMILRKLAKVMDTRNITVASSRSSKLREQLIEFAWCWCYPLVLILLYIPVQSVRYNVWGIEGCIAAYRPTWQSLVLSAMWVPITMTVAVYYAVLLFIRLFRYRREFSRLVMARNSTKSRFIRLFLICIIMTFIVVPYSAYPFYYFCSQLASFKWDYEWERLNGDKKNIILKFPSEGKVHVDKWGQVVLGYVVFLIFGTGTDAYNTYKKMLLALGLGKVFPSLYIMRKSGTSTRSSFVSARTWTSTYVSKAKSYFFKGSSSLSSFGGSTFNNSVRSKSVVLESVDNAKLHSISSTAPVLPGRTSAPTNTSLLGRLFTRGGNRQPILPTFSHGSTTSTANGEKAVVESVPEGFSARAWASEAPSSRRNSESVGVTVFREVHLDEEVRESTERKSADEWMLRP
ncbi:mating-type factor pheromone receptor [Ascochyta rabiei]|uniref:Mating-type factor pheromone receptor n=2 Tax=Didymella rabiei TaxID=5454 RepID=A0A163BLZ6_DIDRA|nr:mating-type factor pheromone receptor [Ascochyta rabiei]